MTEDEYGYYIWMNNCSELCIILEKNTDVKLYHIMAVLYKHGIDECIRRYSPKRLRKFVYFIERNRKFNVLAFTQEDDTRISAA